MDQLPLSATFRFRSRTIRAAEVTSLSPIRQVYRLQIERPTLLAYIPDTWVFIRTLLSWFIDLVQPRAQERWPEWFLPQTIILKRMKESDKPDKTDMRSPGEKFEYEKQAYLRLQPVQGTAVPRYFGEAEYDGYRTLVLSDEGGISLFALDCAVEVDELEAKIEKAFRGIAACGVDHGDAELHNLILVDDHSRIVIVDFEYARFVDDVEWDTSNARLDAQGCYRLYKRDRALLLDSRQLELERRPGA